MCAHAFLFAGYGESPCTGRWLCGCRVWVSKCHDSLGLQANGNDTGGTIEPATIGALSEEPREGSHKTPHARLLSYHVLHLK
jgi:hypothetical protein